MPDKDTKTKDDTIETRTIKAVEIFAVGKWNGDKYTQKDLDDMVTAYNETKDHVKPYLKIGHDERQKLLAEDELPAAGWISNLKRVGEKLVADFIRIPKKIFDLIERGAYRTVSSEIFWNAEILGKDYPRVLKAVSILGAEIPAVSTLDDIMNLGYVKTDEYKVYNKTSAKVKAYEVNLKEQENANMEELEKVTTKLAETEQSLTEANSKVSDLSVENKELKESVEEKTVELAKVELAKKTAEVTAEVDKLIADENMLPADKDIAMTLLKNLDVTKKYKTGDNELTAKELLLKLLKNSKVEISTEQETKDGKPQTSDEDAKVKEYMEKNKGVDYKEALIAISK